MTDGAAKMKNKENKEQQSQGKSKDIDKGYAMDLCKIEWSIKMSNSFNQEALESIACKLSNNEISVTLKPIAESDLIMIVVMPSPISRHDTWFQSLGVFLKLEELLGPIEQIDGAIRSAWRIHFAKADEQGVLDKYKTSLILASEKGDLDAVKEILVTKTGIDINAKSPSGGTALMYAVGGGHLEVGKYLLKHGAKLSPSGGEFTPLQAAVVGGVECVALLLNNGAPIDARNRYGETALIGAARAGRGDTVKLLLEHGADPNAKDYKNKSALDYLPNRSGVYAEIADLLLHFGAVG